MARAAFVALAGQEGASAGLAARLSFEPDWRAAAICGSWRVWTSAPDGLAVETLAAGAGVRVGAGFPMPGAPHAAGAAPRSPALAVARTLSRTVWGRYVALLEGQDGPAVYRDPSGGLDALVWTAGPGVQVVASEIERVPGWLRPRRWALDWNRIGAFLARPAQATSETLFEGIEAVGPGDLLSLGDARRTAVWSPAAFAAEAVAGAEAAAELLRRVDLCSGALAAPHRRLLFELSGGLDSAILAGAFGALGLTDRVAQWLNWAGAGAESDERAYARAVADRLGVPLTALDRAPGRLDPDDLAELAPSLWPAMSGVDAARDRDEAARLEQSGATAIVSGQGGDAIFFQMPSALVLTDEMRRSGWRALSTALPADLARRTQGSVWRVLRDARAAARGRSPPPHRSSLISGELRAATAGVAHAWVEAARDAGVAPGKRLQIEAISNCHVYHGQSRRRRQGELLYPLLAQPVVELCLAIATADLAGGAHDRLYARAVFSERIPEAVRRRRTKGAFNVEFGRLVARSAEVLRPFLVNGCLAEAGLLDREAVRRALDPAVTIQGGQPTEVMWAACVEAWVRYWQTRLPDSRAAPRWPAQR